MSGVLPAPVLPSMAQGKYSVCPTCAGIGKGYTRSADPFSPIRATYCPRCQGTGVIDLEEDDPNLAPKELPLEQRKLVGRFVR